MNPTGAHAGDASPQRLVERALELSHADDCVVIVEEDSSANLRWANNTLTTNGTTRGGSVTVVSMKRGSRGVAVASLSRSGIDEAGLADLVAASERAAADGEPAEDARPLPSPADSSLTTEWDAAPEHTTPTVFGGFTPALDTAFEAARSADRRLFGYAQHSVVTTYLGTSTGLRLRDAQPEGYVLLNAKSSDLSRSSWCGAPARTFTDVDVTALATDAANRLDWAKRTISLPAGRYEALLPPTGVADLYTYMHWMMGARDAHDGGTVFSRPGGGTRVGESLNGDAVPVSLVSDPNQPGLECSPFVVAPTSGSTMSAFDNGLPIGRVDWLRDGTLNALVTTRYSAELTGLPVTPSADNLVMTGSGTHDLPAMIASTERALLLTSLWYIREVDPQTLLLTGLTRDGVYLVEHGEIVGAVNNFRFNESPVGMLSRIVEVGRTEATVSREWTDEATRVAMPPLRVADFNMSTVSQAS